MSLRAGRSATARSASGRARRRASACRRRRSRRRTTTSRSTATRRWCTRRWSTAPPKEIIAELKALEEEIAAGVARVGGDVVNMRVRSARRRLHDRSRQAFADAGERSENGVVQIGDTCRDAASYSNVDNGEHLVSAKYTSARATTTCSDIDPGSRRRSHRGRTFDGLLLQSAMSVGSSQSDQTLISTTDSGTISSSLATVELEQRSCRAGLQSGTYDIADVCDIPLSPARRAAADRGDPG